MEVRRPRLEDKESILEMMAEFEVANEPHDGGFWKAESFDFEDWLSGNRDAELGLYLSDDWVPAIQFVGFEGEKAVGFLHLRLRLNERLLESGGHIGYSVRPTMRQKGYAKDMLRQGIHQAHSKNIRRILLTCHQDNVASRAVIVANGGQLEDVREGIERYWIG